MIQKGDGWLLVERDVERGTKVSTAVEFFVFVPVQLARGQMTIQVVPLVLRKGELVAGIGKLEKLI